MTNPYEPGADAAGAARTEVAYASNTLWTRILIGTLVAAAGADVLGLLIESINLLTDMRSVDWLFVIVLTVLQGLAALLLLPTNVITWLVWQYRAANNAVALSSAPDPSGGRSLFKATRVFDYGPGTSLVWWFVPFANLLMPYRVVEAIWTASNAPLRDPGAAFQRRASIWWGFWIASNISANLAFRLTGFDGQISGVGSVAWWFAHALGLGSAIAAIEVVRALNATQERAAEAIA